MTQRERRRPIGLPALNPIDLRGGATDPAPSGARHSQPDEIPCLSPGMARETLIDLSDPLLANHRVQGANVVPGAVYVDLVYQALAHWGWPLERCELRNLTIQHPQIVGTGERYRLRVEVASQTQSGVELRVISTPCDGSTEPLRLATVALAQIQTQALPALQPPLDTSTTERLPIIDSYRRCAAQGLLHTDVMQATGDSRRRAADIVIRLDARRADAERHVVDPVVLDAMGVALSPFLLEVLGEPEALFVPLLYGRFYAARPLRAACIASIDPSSIRASQDLIRCSVRFFSDDGVAIADLTDFTCKLVRPNRTLHATSLHNAAAEQTEAAAAPARAATSPSEALAQLLQSLLAQQLRCDPAQIALDAGYYSLGLTSSSLLSIVEALQLRLGLPLPPTLFFEYTTIESLVGYLLDQHPSLAAQFPARDTDRSERPPAEASGQARATAFASAGGIDAVAPSPGTDPADPRVATGGAREEPVAIVGMAGRFPQARDVDAFWRNLTNGSDAVTEVPPDRWDWRAFQDVALPSGKPVSKWGGFIDGVDEFDPLFFKIAPREAEAMDPQERLFLEICWEAIEHAGYVPAHLSTGERAVGVYVGVMHKDYAFVGADVLARGETQTPLSLNYAAIANRVSYCFDFRGPSIAIDTVCSASLTAVHFACESLRRGECDVAIAGGVNLSLHPNKYLSYGLMGLHASDGRCRSFGQGGDGYVSAEAVAAVVLKPLQRARLDGDVIYASILSSGVNHVGSGSGITVPDPAAQSALMLRCLKRAGVHPASIDYIETHGTGTSLGDPIEIRALSKVFAAFPAIEGTLPRCALGSVKSNLGHAEAAAGITGLIKAALQLHHRKRVPSLHSDPPNPYLDLASTPFHIQRTCEPWPARRDGPRRSAVNSIGATGSNAFVLLEEAVDDAVAPRAQTALPVLLPLSAKDERQLDTYIGRLLAWLEREGAAVDLPSLAFTLQQGRMPMRARLCLVASHREQVIALLRQVLGGERASEHVAAGVAPTRTAPAMASDARDRRAEQIERLAEAGDGIGLARLWCSGEVIPWQRWPRLYTGNAASAPVPVRRMALPAVPRSPQRYWIGGERRPAAAAFALDDGHRDARSTGTPLLLVPTWEPAADLATASSTVEHGRRLLIGRDADLARLTSESSNRIAVDFEESIDQLARALGDAGRFDSLLLCMDDAQRSLPDALPADPTRMLNFTFRLVKALLQAGHGRRSLDWTVITHRALQVDGEAVPDPVQAAVHGFVGVVAKEQTRWRVRVLDLPDDGTDLERALAATRDLPSGESLVIRGARAYRQRLARSRFVGVSEMRGEAYRHGGVYVIVGGAGGIGHVLTAYLVERYQAQVVWIGRRTLDADIESRRQALGASGPVPLYLSADATDSAQLAGAFAEAKARFGAIHGVVHSAMGELDGSVEAMDEARFAASSRPKIDICVRMAQALASETLDFILFFSSINAFARDHGKSGYAAANTFEDAFALRLAERTTSKVKVVNWGWWADVGVSRAMPQSAIVRMQRLGIAGIQPAQAMRDLEAFLRSPLRQLAVLAVSGSGDAFVTSPRELVVDFAKAPIERLQWGLHSAIEPMPAFGARAERSAAAASPAAIDVPIQEGEGFFEQVLATFAHLLADALKMPASQIDPHESMEVYGVDSILIVHMTQVLERHLDDVSSTLFFEHKTLDALVRHFVRKQPDNLRKLLGATSEQAVVQRADEPARLSATTEPADPRPVSDGRGDARAPARHSGYEPIAIIGMHGRFPQADDLDAFWQNLRAGRDCITPVPADRWQSDWLDTSDVDTAIERGKSYCDQGGFITGFADFDCELFGILPNAAHCMDPQARWFIQSCWLAIEDAGHTPESLRRSGRVGVYAGVTKNGFELHLPELVAQGEALLPQTSFASVANHVSYLFDFAGPSLPIDTMCSASLTAIHEACESLHRGACEVAIAGGVNLYLHPHNYVYLCRARMLSADGRCKSFAADADGFVPGEGVGTVVLKPLARAEADGDHIRAVIIASSTNHGGRTNGYTVPNPQAQQALIEDALARADIDPRSIAYIEAHGTGTALGDPIEIKALQMAFEARARALGVSLAGWRCAIGSAKSNIGHLEAAAGMAGLAKAVLQMQHGELVPSLHAERLNPGIAFERGNFHVQRELAAWPAEVDGVAQPVPRRAGVSSFGAGGANAHVIVEAYREPDGGSATPSDRPALVILSAASESQLMLQAQALRQWLLTRSVSAALLPRIAYTLQCGRVAMAHRLGIVADSVEALIAGLDDYLERRASTRVLEGHAGGQAGKLAKLLSDDDVDLTVSAWIRKGKYRRLLEAWCHGLRVDWRQLYSVDAPPRRLALPGYPLALQRYWLPDRLALRTASAMREASSPARMLAAATAAPREVPVLSLFVGQWCELTAAMDDRGAPASGIDAVEPDQWVWLIDEHHRLPDSVLGAALPEHRVWRPSLPLGDLAERYTALAKQLKARLKALMATAGRSRVNLLIVGADESSTAASDDARLAERCYGGLAALLFSATEEAPHLTAQCFTVSAPIDGAALRGLLRLGERLPASLQVRRLHDRTQLLSLRELSLASEAPHPVWRHDGVYLITGGLGALGLCIGEDVLRSAPSATLILLGRRALDDAGQRQLDRLSAIGGRVEYLRADVSRAAELLGAVAQVRERYGRLHGVIHCAGQLDDGSILRTDDAATDTVFASKVRGLINLDVHTAGFALDFFVCYSSIASLGNGGQADYAAANAFMNQYLRHRQHWVAAGLRQGRSISINWPLWAADGMQVDVVGARKLEATGLLALGREQGLDVLRRVLASRGAETDYYVFFGHPTRLRAALAARFPTLAATAAAVPGETPVPAEQPWRGETTAAPSVLACLSELFAAQTGLQSRQLDPHRHLEAYGIDSVVIMALNRALTAHFPTLPKTLFYQFRTLDEVARHLSATYPDDCARWLLARPLAQAGTHQAAAMPGARAAVVDSLAAATRDDAAPIPARPQQLQREKIAIIGLAGRYPGARSLAQFWENLAAGRASIRPVPEDRWPLDGFYEPDVEAAVAAGKSYSMWGGFIEGFDEFDYLFFGMAPFEVQCIDPQERLFIQCCWHAIEDAGYTPKLLASAHGGRVGVFAGITKTGFDQYGPDLWRQGDMLFPYTSFSSVANRVSYLFDLRGPSLPVDTMCSSSLTAVHQAVESLRRGECDAAIAGGVNLYLHPSTYVGLCARKMLSADGHCRSFGAGGSGFVPGEGVGAVLLKRLSDAERDGDPIHAVIAGTAVNHGGRTHGYTVPNPNAQAEVIASALSDAGLHAEQIDYIEAHGTGTELGDPIEVTGLTEAFARAARARPPQQGRCALGSVKANIGHLEAAAGIAGLTKVVLQLKHRQWVPGLHIEEANPNIDFAESPFRLQKTLADWPAGADGSRRAGVSSFGAGGANAHVVIEAFPARENERAELGDAWLPGLLVLSADSIEQVRACALQLLPVAQTRVRSRADLADFLYTLQIGRVTRSHSVVASVTTPALLCERLQQIGAGTSGTRGVLWHRRADDDAGHRLADVEAILEAPLREPIRWLLQRWLRGEAVDWAEAWRDGNGRMFARRMHLPGYVFRQDRFWIKDKLAAPEAFFARTTAVGTKAIAVAPPSERVVETLLFTESMVARPLADDATTLRGARTPGPVLYFAADAEHREAIAGAFRQCGDIVEFASLPPGAAADPVQHGPLAASEWFQSALTRFAGSVGRPFSVVFASALEQPQLVCDPWLVVALIRAVKQAACVDRLILAAPYFASGPCAVANNGHLEGWEGLRRSLSAMLPDTSVAVFSQQVVDAMDWQAWSAHLLDELSSDALESVRFAGSERLVYDIQEVRLEAGPPRLRQAGTYLITGGAGGLGRAIAAFLLRKYQAYVVLLGRTQESAVDLSPLRALAGDAAQLQYLQGDVCDSAALARAVEHIERARGRIDGVIHAAGLIAERGVFDMGPDEFVDVLRPKIDGSLAIADVFARREPDFIVYMGSAAALLGDFGSANYAYANRFMAQHALASAQPGSRTRHQTIHWPMWRDGGMGRDNGSRTETFLAASGQSALETAEAIACFERALCAQFGQFLVLHGDPKRLRERVARATRAAAKRADVAYAATPDTSPMRQETAEPLALLPMVKRHIAAIIGVPTERIDGAEPFIDLGFDSVHLARLARAIGRDLGIELLPTVLFSYSSPRALSRFLSTQCVVRQPDRQAGERCGPPPASVSSDTSAAAVGSEQVACGVTPAPIAIIGMSGIFPRARCVDAMWASLQNGIDSVDEISADRFAIDSFFDPANGPGTTCSKWMGMVPGVAEFDPLFFELSPVEAEEIDPRQRLLLQESWKALEQAGYGAAACQRHTIGVFVGVEQGDYQQFLGTGDESTNALTTNHDAILAARLSYHLDLHGPVLTINTACSSGLVAAHQACQSLRSGECDTALAASAHLLLSPRTLVAMSQAGMLSPTGRCRAFDAHADGIVAGEAVVVLVLKTLDQARADKNPVLAVIVGSGINYDGRTNGITAPSGASQRRLIETVYRKHAINPEHLDYVLAHGTGTRLGDPVEINALVDAFRGFTDRRGYCAVGSTKTQFGHTFAASGLVSVAAMVKALQHQVIPPSLHCERENELVDWSASPFYVNKRARAWPCDPSRPRMGAVSAFGMSGTNAHMVLAEAEAVEAAPIGHAGPVLLLLSAKSKAALAQKLLDLRDYCRANALDHEGLVRLSYTLSVCRHHFRHRFGLVVDDVADAIVRLERAVDAMTHAGTDDGCFTVARDFEPAPDTLRALNAKLGQALDADRLGDLLSAYLQGFDLDWARCFGEQPLTPLPAPGYPFSTQRYWVGARDDCHRQKEAPPVREQDEVWRALIDTALPASHAAASRPQPAPSFDPEFYTSLMTRLVDDDLSVEDAVRQTQRRRAPSIIGDARD